MANTRHRDKSGKTKAGVIPEPSAHFILWSGLSAVVILIAVIALDYANAWLR